MKRAILPETLRPYAIDDMVRLGRDHDGGYLVSRSDLEHTEILVGLGMADDWSFEADFTGLRDCPLVIYDGSVSEHHFRMRAIKAVARPKKFAGALSTYRRYRTFFGGKRIHVEKFIGIEHGDSHASFDLVREMIGTRRVFMKIDIEGYEYRILDDLLSTADQMSGLAIEFHDCDIHLARILDFVAELPLSIVHVHANNFAPLGIGQVPMALEITFSRFAKVAKPVESLPHPLDMPNTLRAAEVEIRFA